MAKVLKLLINIIFFPIFIYAQPPELKFERITVDEGLSNNTVHGISQDDYGFLWFSTADGLNKFDGYQFTQYRNDPDDSLSLSHDYLWAASEDRQEGKKILWISTSDGGLNIFDLETEQFTRYVDDPYDSASLNIKRVYTIYESSSGLIWEYSDNGLNVHDPKTDKFSQLLKDTGDLTLHDRIVLTFEDTQNASWHTTEKGVYKFDPQTGHFQYYKPDDGELIPSTMWMHESSHQGRDVLWFGTLNGFYKFDIESKKFTRYMHDPDNRYSISDNEIYTAFPYKINRKEVLLIGTSNGLNLLDLDTEQFIRYYNDPADPNSLSDNFILSMEMDRAGVLWIGTHGGGLNKLKPGYKQFNIYRHNPAVENSLSDNSIWSISESEYFGKDVLWIGTKNGGLNKLNRKTGKVTHFPHHPDISNSLSHNWVFKTLESKFSEKNELWIGTYNGLNKLDLKTERYTYYKHEPDTQTSYFFGTRSLFESPKGGREFLWLGAEGLNKFNRQTGRFIQIGETLISAIFEDKAGWLWFGGMEFGLNKFDYNTEEFTTYKHAPDDPNSISSNRITSIYESTLGGNDVLWIGTDKGLNRFDRESERFIHYGLNDGLPSQIINGILEDKHGNLWLSTNHGLSKFDPRTITFRNYDVNDGLQGNQFNEGACFKAEDGEMFFGGINGLNYLYPDSIRDNPHIPPVVITEFRVFNQPVKIRTDNKEVSDDSFTIPKRITYLGEIELSYEETVFTIEFSSLDYTSPEDNQYEYKMDGVDPDWVLTDASRRFATYTQLDPGEYTFQVRGSNNDGLWNNEGTSLRIIITPPWWKTSWAYAVYALVFILTLYALRTYDKKRHLLKHQFELEHMEAEKLKEVDSMKSLFFANISHEFRTPLTLIEGPVKQMLSGESTGNIKEQYKMILRNSDRLLRLINQLLDLSKLESGKLKLQARATDIIRLTNELVQTFESLAVKKQITLDFKSGLKSLVVYIDNDKYEKIITNLLSNAFKFTPENGAIEVAVSLSPPPQSPLDRGDGSVSPLIKGDKGGCLVIAISNTGPEIPADRINNIFDRFYQIGEAYTKDGEGTGIGLALTKELVELHHGNINVDCRGMAPNKTGSSTCHGHNDAYPPESTLDRGDLFWTTFTISFPLGKGHLSTDEIVETITEDSPLKKGARGLSNTSDDTAEIKYSKDINETEKPKDLPIILIVEDNADLRQYIRNTMQIDYMIIEAANGAEGLEKARNKIPDLIISDVMMPKMDGFEFCSKIKMDEITSHIPVILITARAAQEDKIEGLETGADDYITKPFDNKELNVRVLNLIEQRRRLRKKFSQCEFLNPNDVATTSNDSVFLERAMELINKNIADSEFSVEYFAKNIGMSRMQLHRKLKALTDHSTSEFIRIVRLHRAAALLKHKQATVSEIAFEVGFNNLSYFARSFRKHFGKSPSSYSASQN